MPRGQRGFTLAAVIVMLTIILVFLAFTIPQMWSDVMKRERDKQTIWVMKQYARGIKGFLEARKVYPTKLEDLKEQNNPRVLRQLYPNPLSGEMDWVLVPFGTPTPGQGSPNGQPNPTGGTGVNGQPAATPAAPAAQGGPFIGVRPPQTGTSFLSLNGEDSYESWIYTVAELDQDIARGIGQAPAGGPGGPAGGPSGPGR